MTNKEAIAILENLKTQGGVIFSRRLALDLAIKALEERPHGEWINEHCVDIGYKTAECSCCGERSRLISHDTGFGYKYEYYPFCHWCGADMLKEAENE